MESTPQEDEGRETPRKPARKKQAKLPVDLNVAFGNYDIKIESRESDLEIDARLEKEKLTLIHEQRKENRTSILVALLLIVVSSACLFIVLSNRYPSSIQNQAFTMLSAIISGVVFYFKGKAAKDS